MQTLLSWVSAHSIKSRGDKLGSREYLIAAGRDLNAFLKEKKILSHLIYRLSCLKFSPLDIQAANITKKIIYSAVLVSKKHSSSPL